MAGAADSSAKQSCPHCQASLPNGHGAAASNGSVKQLEQGGNNAKGTTKWTEELNCLCSCKNGRRKSQVSCEEEKRKTIQASETNCTKTGGFY